MEGEVGRVQCPDIGCVKAGREATEEEVRRIVTEEELVRWRWLREKRMLDKGQLLFLRLSDCISRRF
jgi:E3 ubiquitin-protein ligase RNF14